MIMGMEGVPELGVNLVQIGVLDQECRTVSTLEVMTIAVCLISNGILNQDIWKTHRYPRA